MAEIIDGKLVSASTRGEIAAGVEKFKADFGYAPGLAVILVGDDPASAVYVRNKERACVQTGITPTQITLPEETTEEELIELIENLNKKGTYLNVREVTK